MADYEKSQKAIEEFVKSKEKIINSMVDAGFSTSKAVCDFNATLGKLLAASEETVKLLKKNLQESQ